VVFYGVMMANRVPGALINGASPPQAFHWRLQTIDDETGAAVTVNYSNPVCSQSNPVNLPASQDSNTMLCFPQTRQLHTEVSVDNELMWAINDRLGFRPRT